MADLSCVLVARALCRFCHEILYFKTYKVSKGAKIRNRYNQAPHLTQDTNEKVTDSQ